MSRDFSLAGRSLKAARCDGPRFARGERSTWASTDRKSTRLNSSHLGISYAVFCLKKKKTYHHNKHNCRLPGARRNEAQSPRRNKHRDLRDHPRKKELKRSGQVAADTKLPG